MAMIVVPLSKKLRRRGNWGNSHTAFNDLPRGLNYGNLDHRNLMTGIPYVDGFKSRIVSFLSNLQDPACFSIRMIWSIS